MVADHAENMGVMPRLAVGDPRLLETQDGQRYYKLFPELPTLHEVLKSRSLEEYRTRNMARTINFLLLVRRSTLRLQVI